MTPHVDVLIRVDPAIAAPGHIVSMLVLGQPCFYFHSDAEMAVWLDQQRERGMRDVEAQP